MSLHVYSTFLRGGGDRGCIGCTIVIRRHSPSLLSLCAAQVCLSGLLRFVCVVALALMTLTLRCSSHRSLAAIAQLHHVAINLGPYFGYSWLYDRSPLNHIFQEDSILQHVLAFLLTDLSYYWYHRAGHEVRATRLRAVLRPQQIRSTRGDAEGWGRMMAWFVLGEGFWREGLW